MTHAEILKWIEENCPDADRMEQRLSALFIEKYQGDMRPLLERIGLGGNAIVRKWLEEHE